MTNIARLYGGSLFDLGLEDGVLDELHEQTRQVREIFRENPDYVRLLSEPSIALEKRCGMIDEALGDGAQKYLVNFLKLLCERGYLGEYAGCCEEFDRRYNEANNITEALVSTAAPLDEKQQSALKAKLEKVTGKRVTLKIAVDTSLIAGLRVEIDGKLMDGTVKSRMTGLSRAIEQVTL